MPALPTEPPQSSGPSLPIGPRLPADRPVRWGITTTGNMANVFTRELRLLPDAEVVAVGSRDAGRAAEFARVRDIPRSYGSYAELADDPDVDVVYVATPHPGHLEVTRRCLQAGKAVLCEKPLTVNAREAVELVELAAACGRFLMEAQWMRCNPMLLRLAERVREGVIGEIRTIVADIGLVARLDPHDRLLAPDLAGGALLDVGVYPIGLAYHLLGLPATVQAWAHPAPTGVDATTGLLLGYESGAVAALSCSIDAILPGRAAVSGTRGWIDIAPSFHDRWSFTVHRPEAEPETESVELLGVGYTHEATEVARCLRAGLLQSPLVTWEDSVATMRLLDEIRAQIGVRYPQDR